MKETYLKLLELLQPISSIRWIDADKGQLSSEKRPPLAFPACLIRIEIINAESQGNKIQLVNLRITLRLAFTFVGATASQTPEEVRNESLTYFDTIQAVYLALQGTVNQNGGRFNRKSQSEQDGEGIKVVNLTFDTTILDKSAST